MGRRRAGNVSDMLWRGFRDGGRLAHKAGGDLIFFDCGCGCGGTCESEFCYRNPESGGRATSALDVVNTYARSPPRPDHLVLPPFRFNCPGTPQQYGM